MNLNEKYLLKFLQLPDELVNLTKMLEELLSGLKKTNE